MKRVPQMQIKRMNGKYYPQFKKFFWRNFITRKRTMADCWNEVVWFDTPYRAAQWLSRAVANLKNKQLDYIQVASVDEADIRGIFVKPDLESGFRSILQDDIAVLNLKKR